MPFILAGVSHHRTPIGVRERLSLAESMVPQSLEDLAEYNGLLERLILSTCNRMEVYGFAQSYELGVKAIQEFFCDIGRVAQEELKPHLYVSRDLEAVRHLFLVTSSLDSMVVGEPQILGQVKDAYRIAREGGHAGKRLVPIFSNAFRVAKKVREQTSIGENPVSVSSVAVELAKKIFGALEGKTVMVVGAGKMAGLAARHLIRHGVSTVLVANRTLSRAEALASELAGEAIPYENLAGELPRCDIVITSTGAPQVVVNAELVAQSLKARRDAPMFFIDIAVPRDVEPRVNDLENVFVYDIDDLQAVIKANLQGREAEAQEARSIVEKEVASYARRHHIEELSRSLAAIRVQAESFRRGELDKTFASLASLGERERKGIDAMTRALVNKLLHRPFEVIREIGEDNSREDTLALIQRLFGVENPGAADSADEPEEK